MVGLGKGIAIAIHTKASAVNACRYNKEICSYFGLYRDGCKVISILGNLRLLN